MIGRDSRTERSYDCSRVTEGEVFDLSLEKQVGPS